MASPPSTLPPGPDETEQSAPAGARVRKFWLHVLEGPDEGVSLSSRGKRVTVGTAEGADLRLQDRAVSKFHCEFSINNDQVTLRDLGSRNGTQVAGVKVREAYLEHGATLLLGRTRLRFELDAALLSLPSSTAASFGRLLGGTEAMKQVFALLERATSSPLVLLEGEAGTGKSEAAHAIHEGSPVAHGPLVVVEGGALPPDQIEATLFGGPGAPEGALRAAAGGTLYLADICDLPGRAQLRLAQALERRSIPPAGGSGAPTPLAFRLIASTRRDLRTEVNLRRFRAELYYLLSVLEIRLPPLRERPEDIPLLYRHFASELRPDAPPLSPEQAEDLQGHGWPGNVRELRAYAERCLATGQRAPLAPEAVFLADIDASQPLRAARERWVEDCERRYLIRQMSRHQNNVSAAARASGVDRVHFYRLLWRYALK